MDKCDKYKTLMFLFWLLKYHPMEITSNQNVRIYIKSRLKRKEGYCYWEQGFYSPSGRFIWYLANEIATLVWLSSEHLVKSTSFTPLQKAYCGCSRLKCHFGTKSYHKSKKKHWFYPRGIDCLLNWMMKKCTKRACDSLYSNRHLIFRVIIIQCKIPLNVAKEGCNLLVDSQ